MSSSPGTAGPEDSETDKSSAQIGLLDPRDALLHLAEEVVAAAVRKSELELHRPASELALGNGGVMDEGERIMAPILLNSIHGGRNRDDRPLQSLKEAGAVTEEQAGYAKRSIAIARLSRNRFNFVPAEGSRRPALIDNPVKPSSDHARAPC